MIFQNRILKATSFSTTSFTFSLFYSNSDHFYILGTAPKTPKPTSLFLMPRNFSKVFSHLQISQEKVVEHLQNSICILYDSFFRCVSLFKLPLSNSFDWYSLILCQIFCCLTEGENLSSGQCSLLLFELMRKMSTKIFSASPKFQSLVELKFYLFWLKPYNCV